MCRQFNLFREEENYIQQDDIVNATFYEDYLDFHIETSSPELEYVTVTCSLNLRNYKIKFWPRLSICPSESLPGGIIFLIVVVIIALAALVAIIVVVVRKRKLKNVEKNKHVGDNFNMENVTT